VTGTGKLMRVSTLQNHRMKKKANEKRRLDRESVVGIRLSRTMRRMAPTM
jgi:ribosomal protein L35